MLITHEEGKIIPAPVIRDVWDCLPKRPKKPLVFRKKSTTENQYQERTNQKIIQQIREELTRSATLSLDVRDALVQEFPLTETNEVARRLLLWTIVGKQKKDAEGNVLLFDEPMSQVLGCAPRKGNKGDVYRWFRDTVNPNFRFSDYHHQAHKCRVMQCSGTEHLKMSFLYTNRKNQVRFYRDSLRKVTKASSEARVRKIKKMALSLRFPLADQQLIADYMHSLSSHTFDVSDEVYAAAFTQAVEEHNEHWLTCLQDFVDDSTPIYFPSQNTRRHRGKTPRLFGTGLPIMPTELRKILFPQFIDMDMRHCHLTIFAYVFHVPAAKAILEQGESFWDELLHFSHLKQETKSIIKKAFYALLCGAHPQRQNYQLEKDLAEDFQETYSRPITDHPVVKELLQAVEYVKRQIHEDGGIETPYGWLPYYEQDMKSFLSCVLQRYELAIIAECFRFVKKQKQNHKSTFKIVLFQHDGLSIQVNPGVDPRTVIAQLQKRVWEKGMEFGIPMHFDVKGEIPAFVPTKNPINNNNSTIHPLSSSITTNTNTEIDTPIFPHRESVREMLGGSTRGNLDSQKMRFFRTCMQEFFWSKETYYGCVLKEKRYRFSRKMRHFDGLDPPFG